MSSSTLPAFLQPAQRVGIGGPQYSCRNATFHHSTPLSPVDALWWPCLATSDPKVVILFIPGNPGLLDFYAPFLSRLHAYDTTGALAILAHAHIGHTPGVGSLTGRHDTGTPSLVMQVESALEALDAIRETFSSATIIIVGHSVGAWISLQIIKFRSSAAGAFLLFPTIRHIARTPNGRMLSWLFRYSIANMITFLSSMARFVPTVFLAQLFPSWPVTQLLVLQDFICCPKAVFASLCMANDEMNTIRELDIDLIHRKNHCLWMYLGERDDWVGNNEEHILQAFSEDGWHVQIVHGARGTPHAFCINHSEQLAAQCFCWMRDLLPSPVNS